MGNYNMRDGRNPYGSAGGYVSSRRPMDRAYSDREMDDEARYGRMSRGMRRDREMDDEARRGGMSRGRGRDSGYDMGYYEGEFRGVSDHDYNDYGDYEMRRDRVMWDRAGRNDYRSRDYARGYLSNHELREWQDKLCKELDQNECEMLQFDHIIKQAEEMNIHFDRYSKEEFYTTVLMMYTDYKKSCGGDVGMCISLAKEFLEDSDAKVRFGEKLAAYCEAIADV